MKRGDLVLIREPNSPASKARPFVVVQRDSGLDDPTKITACPLTSRLNGLASQRPFVSPSSDNHLSKPSEIQIDWIYTHRIERVDGVIGCLDAATMDAVDRALRNWLHL